MTSSVRRAGVVAGLSTLSLAVPVLGPAGAAPIAAVVLVAAVSISDGRLFDLLALPADRSDGRLTSLIVLVVAVILLGILAGATSLSWAVFVGTLLLVGYGTFAAELVRESWGDAAPAVAYCVGGGLAAVGGIALTHAAIAEVSAGLLPTVVFLGVSGALAAAIVREQLPHYDDPLVLLAVGLLLWLLESLEPVIGSLELAIALAVVVGLGSLSYLLDTASVAGMLSGVLLSFLTIVLGGWGWFLLLISFFAIGGLSTKYQYERKAENGVAEANDGARGSSNVFSNSAVALVAVLGYAASDTSLLGIDSAYAAVFLYAFAGAIATALGDTLSSEIGGLYDEPRLITTLQPVEPGTDGGVTWQGEVAGLAGAGVVGVIAGGAFATVPPVGVALIVFAGLAGMTVDSLLGATVEGTYVGNQGVNFLATLAGSVVAAVAAITVGPVA